MKLSLLGYNLDSRDATIFIGYYTLFIHFLATFFFLDALRGSNSDWVVSPLFEYPQATSFTLGSIFASYCIAHMISSLGLVRGVKTVSEGALSPS